MSDRTLRGLAWVVVGAMFVGLAAALAFALASGASLRSAALPALATAVWGGVGAALAIARPRNAVGWLLLAIGGALTLSLTGGGYVDWSKTRDSELSGASTAAWLASSGWVVVIAFLIPRFLVVFPDGRLPSRRWRLVAAAQYVVLAGLTIGALSPGPLPDTDYKRYDNPVGIGALDWLNHIPSLVGPIAGGILITATFGAAVSLVARFRGSQGIARQQVKWVAWATGLTASTWILGTFLPQGAVHDFVEFVAILGLTLAPLTILVAVLRYRLYEIDRLISRTLVYGVLTVVLGTAYVGLVLAGQALFSSFAGGSNLAIAVSTLVVAALFLPVRTRIQRIVDRRFYRHRYDAVRTLEAFGTRLRDELDLEALSAEMVGVVTETMQPAQTSVWLRGSA